MTYHGWKCTAILYTYFCTRWRITFILGVKQFLDRLCQLMGSKTTHACSLKVVHLRTSIFKTSQSRGPIRKRLTCTVALRPITRAHLLDSNQQLVSLMVCVHFLQCVLETADSLVWDDWVWPRVLHKGGPPTLVLCLHLKNNLVLKRTRLRASFWRGGEEVRRQALRTRR